MRANGGPTAAPAEVRRSGGPTVLHIKDSATAREMYMQQVFQPDIPLPTMSLAEFARLEMEECQRNDKRRQQQEFDRAKAIHDLGEETVVKMHDEHEEAKARSWDDWKDENPRGSGNKMRNVG